jgi:hypothetical protein
MVPCENLKTYTRDLLYSHLLELQEHVHEVLIPISANVSLLDMFKIP